jgi:Ca-activated chloride channel family protein
MPEFLEPARLWLLVGVIALAVVYVVSQFIKRRYTVRFSSLEMLDSVAPKRTGWGRHVLAFVFLCALAIGVAGIAQPADEQQVPKERATIMLAMDTSLSMEATDVDPSRLDAAKEAARSFVEGIPEKLQVGLVTFDTGARVLVNPTNDHADVSAAIESLELSEGTAIGDAVITSLAAIETAPESPDGEPVPAAIVLLSDGHTTVGRDITDVIPAANDADIPVSTIAYGTPNGFVDITIPETGIQERIPVPVDAQALADLAEGTGGSAFTAESAEDLTAVYQELGTSIGFESEFTDVTWKFLAAAMALLALTALASMLWFQRLP